MRVISAVWLLTLSCAAMAALADPPPSQDPREVRLPVSQFQFVRHESGPDNYYAISGDPALPFISGRYRPPMKTAVLGLRVADTDRRATVLRWRWRAVTLPAGANECVKGKDDSAAAIYVVFRRGLRWYALKYVWSATGARGAVCASIRNPIVVQDTEVLESGGPLNTWVAETIDLPSEFRRHFKNDDPEASVPDLLGIGLRSNGDHTQSASAADFSDFVIVR